MSLIPITSAVQLHLGDLPANPWLILWVIASFFIAAYSLYAAFLLYIWFSESMETWRRSWEERNRAAAPAARSETTCSWCQAKSYFKSLTGTRSGRVASMEEGESEFLWNRSATALSDVEELEGIGDDTTVVDLGDEDAEKKRVIEGTQAPLL
ncbi:hypothetical protein FA95DRAFT_1602533 [Auriscalpium vulgare]|uniref:Uncharacterized protein n=1 Tax=Auriscalpium vulgare TaxID=40419 RepID=A0ACB8S6A3_9AGAM|nr:hypothetical protein FA95DRAFT_1602533 [Auriscalpium vulgare]